MPMPESLLAGAGEVSRLICAKGRDLNAVLGEVLVASCSTVMVWLPASKTKTFLTVSALVSSLEGEHNL